MYVGRIVGVGRDHAGRAVLAYRVSSRSFPNRSAELAGRSARIVPRPGSPDAVSESPYIAYECLVWDDHFAVVSNGSHTRPIFERLKSGSYPRDAMLSVLAGLDREFDQYDTPRICGLIDRAKNLLWLGGITATSLAVMPVDVKRGEMDYITTYGFPLPKAEQVDIDFSSSNAAATCRHIVGASIFAGFDRAVCAAALVATHDNSEVAVLNV